MPTPITVPVSGQGLSDITPQVRSSVREAGCTDGICHLFIQHTSASLLIQENYGPSARADLEAWLNRLSKQRWFVDVWSSFSEGTLVCRLLADTLPKFFQCRVVFCEDRACFGEGL